MVASPPLTKKVCEAPFQFRRSKHELFVIASKADSALGLEALDDLKDLTRVWATIDVVAEKDQLASARLLAFVDSHASIWPRRFWSFAAMP